jgi:zinc/manganese transport system permease protein
MIGWLGGAAASAFGLAASFEFELPAGAAMVVAFALSLAVAVILRGFISVPAEHRKHRFGILVRCISVTILSTVSATMIWLMAMPGADQPMLNVMERAVGIGPETFLTPSEREIYADAERELRVRRSQATQQTNLERQSRWQGAPLSDDAVRRIGAFQQAFNEMARGEDFVVKSLSTRARERERWYVGPATLAAAVLGLVTVVPRRVRARFFSRSRSLRAARMLRRSTSWPCSSRIDRRDLARFTHITIRHPNR